MPVAIHVDPIGITVTASGIDGIICFTKKVDVPFTAIIGAKVVTQSEAKGELGWRIGGGYLPNHFATGWFTMPNQKGRRQWWAAFRDAEVLVIETNLKSPGRIVVQTPDRTALAAQIHALAGLS